MGLEFTRLNVFKTDHRSPLDVDQQVMNFIQVLDGKLDRWQILSPTPTQRVLYYEMENSAKPEKVDASMLNQRAELEGAKTKKTK